MPALPELDPKAVMTALRLDKKRRETGVPFVLLPRLGETVIKDGVPLELVAEVLEGILGGGGQGFFISAPCRPPPNPYKKLPQPHRGGVGRGTGPGVLPPFAAGI